MGKKELLYRFTCIFDQMVADLCDIDGKVSFSGGPSRSTADLTADNVWYCLTKRVSK